jgi:hypothetical protein
VAYEEADDRRLAELIAQERQHVAVCRERLADMEAELGRRQELTAAEILQAAGKETGTLAFSHGGMKFKAERAKKVTWDSDKLKAIAQGMPWEMAQRLFDIEFRVPENTYKAIHSPELIAKLDEARTTKTGDLRVVFVGFEV